MRLVRRRHVRQHRRDGIADAYALRAPRRETSAALIGLRPGEAAALIDRADVIGIDRRAAR